MRQRLRAVTVHPLLAEAKVAQITRQLNDALEREAATFEVLDVISSSPGEVEQVFLAILKRATRLCDAKFGFVHRYDGQFFHPALINPGWVKTDMGGPNATLTPRESVTAMRRLIEKLDPDQSGKFFHYDGSEYPW